MHYALCRYDWRGDGYYLPPGAVAGVDLRPLAEQCVPGIEDSGPVFCASPVPIPREFVIRRFERSRRTAQWLWDRLTIHADPLGCDGPRPLVPTIDRLWELKCGGIHVRRPAQWGRLTGSVQAVLRRDFSDLWEARDGDDHCLRVLDWTCEKYRVNDWREFVPRRLWTHVPGRLLHATTITDDFTRADGTTIGNLLTWTEVANDLATVSNAVKNNGPGVVSNYARARAESDLSGVDHYSQAKLVLGANTGRGAGVHARYASAADTCYGLHYMGGGGGATKIPILDKHVTGTRTELSTGSATDWSDGSDIAKCEINGSSLTGYRNGGSVVSVTDTAISGGTRCGIFVRARASSDVSAVDDFEAGDLAASFKSAWVRRQSNRVIGGGVI